MPGKKPASASPRRKRKVKKLTGPLINAKPPETRPQVTIIRAIQRRAPTRSRIKLLGTSSMK
jgi:hypothetical protein